jgi:chitodextrinase
MPKLVNHLRGTDTQKRFLEVAYGLHIVEGDLCKSLKTDGDPFDIYVQHKLGKREWNACKALWWRGFKIPDSDFVFHPGKLSSGPTDPIQGVDSIFDSDIPHSLTAWMRAKLPQSEIQDIDPATSAPEGLYGIYETLLVNNYSSSGVITDFSYSANPARIVADLFLIEGRRNPSRIDWGAWREWADVLQEPKLVDYSQIPNFPGFGLTAEYYSGQAFNTLIQTRVDAVVEFLESSGAPAYGLPPVDFSARFEGKIKPKYTETHTFFLTHNDGGKLWVNNSLIIDQWGTTGTHSATIALTANELYAIKVEWKNGSGNSEIRLEWESSTQPREVVPADRLYPKPVSQPNYEAHIEFTQPTRLDDAIRSVLALCNSTYQRVNGKYRFFSYEQLQASSFTFDESTTLYPETVEIEPLDLAEARNVWQCTFRDLESQYLEQVATPPTIELANLINLAGRRNEGEILDFQTMTRWQAYRLLEARAKRAVAENSISFSANCESYSVLRGDRVKINLEMLNLSNYEARVTRSIDLSGEKSADDRRFTVKEWYPSDTLVPELVADETAPTAPSLSGEVISSSQINTEWTASTDNRGVAGYEIDQNGTVSDLGLVLFSTRNGLAHSTSYSFKVRAYDLAGNRSAWSNTATLSTPVSTDTTPPTVPTSGIAAPVSTVQINLSWNAATDNVAVAGYEIEQNGTVHNVGLVLTNSRSGLEPSTLYSFRVRAYDSSGNRSAWSATFSATTLSPETLPTTPTLSVTSFDYYVDCFWSFVENADGYELEENGVVYDLGTSLNDTRTPGGGYSTYRIRAYNAEGPSEWSDVQAVYLAA